MKFRHFNLKERRRRLAKKVDRLDRLETRNTITEPISVTGLAISFARGTAIFGFLVPSGGGSAPNGLARPHDDAKQAGPNANKPSDLPRTLLRPLPDFVPVHEGVSGAAGASKAAEATAQ